MDFTPEIIIEDAKETSNDSKGTRYIINKSSVCPVCDI